MNGRAPLLNPAGGLSYHLRAARYAAKLWQPTCAALAHWLARWQPPERHLVVVGPSAGYTLPLGWFTRFDQLTLLEPDPLARWLFGWRMRRHSRSPQLTFVPEDHLLEAPDRLLRLVHGCGDAALLFSNVLGQLQHLLGESPGTKLDDVKRMVRAACQGRSWASYHDRVSGRSRPALPETGLHASRRLVDEDVGSLYSAEERPVTLYDHGSDGIFPAELPHVYFAWELTPGYVHLLEGVSQTRV